MSNETDHVKTIESMIANPSRMVLARDELLPCPFCGGKASITEDNYKGMRTGVVFIVGCDNEECDLQFPGCDTKTLATKIWNRREGYAAASIDRAEIVREAFEKVKDAYGSGTWADKQSYAGVFAAMDAVLREIGDKK